MDRETKGSGAATFQTEGGATLLKVWTYGVTREGNSVALSGTLSVRQGDDTRSFELRLSDGQTVLPVVPGACQVDITFSGGARGGLL